MSIEDPEGYCRSLWDWGCLNGCFGDSGIRPQDVDGEVERHGHFLHLETKGSGVPLKEGQRRCIQAKVDTGRFTVIVVWGKPQQPEKLLFLCRGQERLEENASLELLRHYVACWYRWADQQTTDPACETAAEVLERADAEKAYEKDCLQRTRALYKDIPVGG